MHHQVIERKYIECRFRHALIEIHPESKEAVFLKLGRSERGSVVVAGRNQSPNPTHVCLSACTNLERTLVTNFRRLVAAAIAIAVFQYSSVSSVCAQPSTPPSRTLPSGALGEAIHLGEMLVEQTVTHPLTKPYVGNALNCTSCHLKNGTDRTAATFFGVATAYPAWSRRERRVITLEDRILNCFMRSCNGIRPPLGSKPSVAIAAYITWLSEGEALRMNAENPKGPNAVLRLAVKPESASIEHGERLYTGKCATCHGMDGAGKDDYPPVWGWRSFNQGAGLADTIQLASWIKVAMPMDETDLSDQESLDIAAFVNTHDRLPFVLKDHLPMASRLGEYNAEQPR